MQPRGVECGFEMIWKITLGSVPQCFIAGDARVWSYCPNSKSKLTKSKLKWEKPEDEDKETEQSEERCDVVHRVQHNDELMTQRRQKPNQFEYPK